MTGAQWWSQPVAPEGFTASEGIRRQLGRPHLDPLTVLIRETAQNSCDAALPGGGDIDFAVRLKRLSGNGLLAWQEFLLPEPDGSDLGIAETIAQGPLLMTIADRGTTGLGGPLGADENPVAGERPDFVNFIRNVGANKAVDLSGGSYGFGKGIIYNVSRCHVIVADTICTFRGRRQRRLIGAALGDAYAVNGRRFTGRHWLGVEDGGHTRPLLDREADEMAARLGLSSFADGATGTTVAIVDVDLGRRPGADDVAREPDDAAEFIASTMLWNLWPRMISGRASRLVCSVRRDGFATEIPDPEQLIELNPFVQAYRALSENGHYQVPPRRAQPAEVGRFALIEGMAPVRVNPLVAAASPLGGRSHHCARMRQADLIVDYVAGEAHPDEAIQYGAVFRASEAANAYFAEAEPPTHDDWVIDGLRRTARGVVQLATAFVRDRLREKGGETTRPTPTGEATLGALASRLAGLVTAEGDAAEASTRARPGGRGSTPTLRPRIVEGPELVDGDDGRPLIRAMVQLPDWSACHIVTAEPAIVLDGGLEPLDELEGRSAVIGWRSATSGDVVSGPELAVDPAADRRWEVRLRAEPEAVVRLSISFRSGGAAT
ncbi:hypothetical protein [Sporichthya sp.]|uniref:hypothetical protein n=1 Tax=Sporichthya sp. TaxID=65475 RepID=UPI001859938B|nr:hypothetical protein [Sporichthya sp.]MBA3744497.1 hypothetical protein [Sporichthya sp.]